MNIKYVCIPTNIGLLLLLAKNQSPPVEFVSKCH